MVKVGIIGGSGLDDPNLLENYNKIDLQTPYGQPSSSITVGILNGIDVAILSRHGPNHQIMPSNVNFRANIWALKELGCTHIIATTAVGSLREEMMKILQIVEQLMQMHIKGLKELGVDLEKVAKETQKGAKPAKKKAEPIEDMLK